MATVLWNYGLASTPAAREGLFLHLVLLVSVLGGSPLLDELIATWTGL